MQKEKAPPKNFDEYLALVPEPSREMLIKMHTVVRSVMPKESAEVISYGIPAFKHNKMLVWYAVFKGHSSLFPSAAVIEQFKAELKGYTISKGTVQFSLEKPLPVALVKKLVKARVMKEEKKKR